jgi:hypothetical protein
MEKQKKTFKFKRRRAIECELLKRSESHKGYLKYRITLQEKNGEVHEEIAYGKDMQDALSRLVWTERTKKVESRMGAGWFFITWCIIMGWPALMMDQSQPWYLLYSFGTVFALFGLAGMWYTYLEKK